MHLGHYIDMVAASHRTLARAFTEIGAAHASDTEVALGCVKLAARAGELGARLEAVHDRYRDDEPDAPDRLHSDIYDSPRTGPLGLLRDLHDLYLIATECDIIATLVRQGASGARDEELLSLTTEVGEAMSVQLAWLRSHMKQAAPQALVVTE